MNKLTYVILAALLVVSGSIFAISRYQRELLKPKNETTESALSPKSPFIGCLEQRDYLEVDNLLYIACNGGVVAVDPSTNNIVRTLTMADGLANEFSTSLVKHKDNLYIGSQDGLTQYNLTSQKAKIINTKNGLSNGANIRLMLDGETLWVASFDGLDSIDLNTLNITKHKQDILSQAGSLNTTALAKTDNYVYASILGDSKSTGFIARLDKSTKKWTTFTRDDFNNVELNINNFYVSDTNVYAFNLLNTQEEFDSVFEQAIQEEKVWKQTAGEDNWTNITEADKEVIRSAIGYFNKPYVSLTDDKTVNKLWHVVNSKVISGGGVDISGKSIVILDHKTLETSLAQNSPEDTNLIFFEPLEFTNLSVAIFQVCGQGCGKPRVYLHNYATNNLDEVSLPLGNVANDYSYDYVASFDTQNLTLSLLNTSTLTQTAYKLDTLTKQFTKSSSQKLDTLPDMSHPLKAGSNVYDFNSRFSLARRLVTASGKEDIAKLGITYTSNDTYVKLQYMNKEYTLNMLPKRYSPFADWLHTIEVRKVQLDNNVLFVSTNRGLMRIDTNTGITTLFGPKDGLISPDIKDFIFVDGKIIAAYNGLSVVE